MRQVSEEQFISIVNQLKQSESFKNFVGKVQKRADKFLKERMFCHGKKKCQHIIPQKGDIPRDNDPKNIMNLKFVKILELLVDVEFLFFMTPSDLETLFLKVGCLKLGEDSSEESGFSNKIQSLLMYSELRSGNEKLLNSFYRALNIKSCAYCNAQHTIILNDDEKTMRLQADHNKPKSTFPMFSITLANLIPVCNNCNHLKGDKDLNYYLYYNDKDKEHHDLGFEVTNESIVSYCTHRNSENSENILQISFKDHYGDNLLDSSGLNKVLKIDKIYENHKDIVADLINKRIVYKNSYLKSLAKEFDALFKTADGSIKWHLFNQMLYGHSLNKNDINKKVFSKLTIDIKKQLDDLDLGAYVNGE